ncbi:uncharacterized protein [Hyperolius riggenbachi]|uniref:uncharacterized protein isoform X2 n=1 Tax=Hyperolius riggenbachi TaxID=752182 RepID=UPI0035A2C9D0
MENCCMVALLLLLCASGREATSSPKEDGGHIKQAKHPDTMDFLSEIKLLARHGHTDSDAPPIPLQVKTERKTPAQPTTTDNTFVSLADEKERKTPAQPDNTFVNLADERERKTPAQLTTPDNTFINLADEKDSAQVISREVDNVNKTENELTVKKMPAWILWFVGCLVTIIIVMLIFIAKDYGKDSEHWWKKLWCGKREQSYQQLPQNPSDDCENSDSDSAPPKKLEAPRLEKEVELQKYDSRSLARAKGRPWRNSAL